MATSLPLFLYDGDAPVEQPLDFVHVETIASRAPAHQWSIRAHRHRNLFQIILVERAGGEMTFETSVLPFAAPAAILLAPGRAHGFRFHPGITDGWVVSFTGDAPPVAGRDALSRFTELAAEPILPLADADCERLSRLCGQMHEESVVGREGFALAMRGLLATLAVDIARLAAGRARAVAPAHQAADTTVDALRRLVEEHFRKQRLIGFYAEKLAMTPDRLNDHLKRALGVTAGHLIRQRVLTEAKHQLVFTTRPIQDISDELSFFDQSHFARFFRKQTGLTPQEFRERAGG
jgi:AraC family transcriptional regulator, transcriptional activator of pobA